MYEPAQGPARRTRWAVARGESLPMNRFTPTPRALVMSTALLGGIALVTSCTEANPTFRSFCDAQGCYQCARGSSCTKVPNKPCSANAQCSAGQTCTTIGCAASCSGDRGCHGDLVCVKGYCVPDGFKTVKPKQSVKSCKADADCSSDEYCGANGTCVTKCRSDDECAPGTVCNASCGKCQPADRPASCGVVPSFCSSAVKCGDGKRCRANRCHFACGDKTKCPVGQVCRSGLCIDDPAPADPECVLDIDCTNGSCINGYCHARCSGSSECGFGMLCQMGVCQPNYYP